MPHEHTHVSDTTCKDCDSENHLKVTHAHDDGHVPHQHRNEGLKLIKLEDEPDEIEKEIEKPDKESDGEHRTSWHDALDEI
jgi:hypothetical protein